MTTNANRVYDFVFRGLLTEEALDSIGRKSINQVGDLDAEIAKNLSLEMLPNEFVASAKQMATVYIAIAAFENSVRKLITSVLKDSFGDNWWEKGASDSIKKGVGIKQRDELKFRWHTQRGEEPINYTTLDDLRKIIQNNLALFQTYIISDTWASNILNVIERSRNVIMHSGYLSIEDIARVGMNIRDWLKQVGG